MKTAWKIVRNAVDQFINEFSRFFARIHVHRSSGKDAADRLTVPLIANGIIISSLVKLQGPSTQNPRPPGGNLLC